MSWKKAEMHLKKADRIIERANALDPDQGIREATAILDEELGRDGDEVVHNKLSMALLHLQNINKLERSDDLIRHVQLDAVIQEILDVEGGDEEVKRSCVEALRRTCKVFDSLGINSDV